MIKASSGKIIPHNRLTFGREEVNAVSRVIESGYWACGPQVKVLEKTLCNVTKRKHAVAVGSGLSAIRLALLSLGVKPNDEIIVPAYSCVALANAVLSVGAMPVTVDIIPEDWNIDPDKVAKKITRKTKAIIAVHTFGLPAKINELKKLGVPVIEDCAHALGISVLGKGVGSVADIAVTSFYATKLVGGGEGGAVLANDKRKADFVKQWRDYGDQLPSAKRLNDKMTDIEAALVLTQLKRLKSMLIKRSSIARIYEKKFSHINSNQKKLFCVPVIIKTRVWYRYVVEMKGMSGKEATDKMTRLGIKAEKPITDWRPKNSNNEPVADRAYQNIISLPIYPTLTTAEQSRVCDGLMSVIGNGARL